MKLLEFYSESNGRLSNTRLNGSLCVYGALAIILGAAFGGAVIDKEIIIILLTAGFGSKLIQKPFEGKVSGEVK